MRSLTSSGTSAVPAKTRCSVSPVASIRGECCRRVGIIASLVVLAMTAGQAPLSAKARSKRCKQQVTPSVAGTWTLISTPFRVADRSRIDHAGPFAVDPLKPSRMYAISVPGTSQLTSPPYSPATLMRSSDGGCTWQDAEALPDAPSLDYPVSKSTAEMEGVAATHLPGDRTRVYLLLSSREPFLLRGVPPTYLAVSDDSGHTWRLNTLLSYPIDLFPTDLIVSPSDPDTLFLSYSTGLITYSTGLMVSSDAGRSWDVRSLPPGTATLAIDPRNPQSLWASTDSMPYVEGAPGIHHSTDGGGSWKRVLELKKSALAIDVFHARGSSPRIVVFADRYFEDAKVLWSKDGGATWQQRDTPIAKDAQGRPWPGGGRHWTSSGITAASGRSATQLVVGAWGTPQTFLLSREGWVNITPQTLRPESHTGNDFYVYDAVQYLFSDRTRRPAYYAFVDAIHSVKSRMIMKFSPGRLWR